MLNPSTYTMVRDRSQATNIIMWGGGKVIITNTLGILDKGEKETRNNPQIIDTKNEFV